MSQLDVGFRLRVWGRNNQESGEKTTWNQSRPSKAWSNLVKLPQYGRELVNKSIYRGSRSIPDYCNFQVKLLSSNPDNYIHTVEPRRISNREFSVPRFCRKEAYRCRMTIQGL